MGKLSRVQWSLIIVAILILIGVIAGGIYEYVARPTVNMSFALVKGNTAYWYTLTGNKVTPAKGPEGYEKFLPTIYDVAPKLKSNDIPALAKSTTGVINVGVIRGNTTFIPFLSGDGSMIFGIDGRDDGMVVFSKYIASSTSATTTQKGNWYLESYPLYNSGSNPPRMLGVGFDPVFAGDGSVVAVVPGGIARVNADFGGQYLTIHEPNTSYETAAISPDAKMAVLLNSITGNLDVYTIASPHANTSSYIGSINDHALGIAFLTPTSFIVQTGEKSFVTYSVTSGKIATSSIASL